MSTLIQDDLLKEISSRYCQNGPRKLIGLAGAPGSGKSTLARWLVDNLNNGADEAIAAVLPQDGFHYDDRILKQRKCIAFKGAPDTFDTNGLLSMLKRALVEPEIAIPVFDRELEISRNCAEVINPVTRLLIVEGNYLLLDRPECWSRLRRYFDMTIYLDVPIEELQRRLMMRWLNHGYSEDLAKAKIMENDLPNAKFVIKNSVQANWIISNQKA